MIKRREDEPNSGPAYKQLWFWLILSPLLTSFVVGFTMLALAIKSNDGAALGSYQKSGFDTTRTYQRENNARSLNMIASLQLNAGEIRLKLAGDYQPPKQLRLNLMFPTSKTLDVEVLLQRQGEYYIGSVEPLDSIKRIIQLSELSKSPWLLQAKVDWPIKSAVVLTPYLNAN